MGLFNRNKKQENQLEETSTYTIKKYLSESEFAVAVASIVDSITNSENTFPWYALEEKYIRHGIVEAYTDLDIDIKEDITDFYNEVIAFIDLDQCDSLKCQIEKGIQYELTKQVNMFGDMSGIDDAMSKFTEFKDSIGEEKFEDLMQLSLQNNVAEAAKAEAQKELKSKKSSKKKS